MITAPLGVKPSVVTPVRQRSYGRVSVLFFAVPCVRSHSASRCWCPRNRWEGPEHAQPDICSLCSDVAGYRLKLLALTRSDRSHLPAIKDPPQAMLNSMIVEPASVPTPTLTCKQKGTAHLLHNKQLHSCSRQPASSGQLRIQGARHVSRTSLHLKVCGHARKVQSSYVLKFWQACSNESVALALERPLVRRQCQRRQ